MLSDRLVRSLTEEKIMNKTGARFGSLLAEDLA